MARHSYTPNQTTIILQLTVIFCCIQTLLSDCPRLCECKWKSGKESVICLNANLSSIPLELDAGTQVLDLTGNNLLAIKNDEFGKVGLVNLQKVFISKSKLKMLEKYCFRKLINLVELDLSYNTISAIPTQVFESIPELRELKLSGNPIQKILDNSFIHLPQLVRLELSECKVASIESKAFLGLEDSLEWLKLDGNRLVDVSSKTLTSLQNLHGLELAGNPWNCSCSLRPLREWMLHQNVPFGIPPLCKNPPRLSSRPWDRLDLDEFACVPKILAPDPKAHGVEGRNITMTCRIAGIPEPSVRWMIKNRVIANISNAPQINGKKLYVVHLQNSSSNLTILTADVQDAGVYICAAENKAGKVEASVTLAVSRKPPENNFKSKAVLAGIIMATLFVVSICLVVLCILSVRKRKATARWQNRRTSSGRRIEDNYEKIEMNHLKLPESNGGQNITLPHIGEVSLLPPIRKNGEYRGVPCLDSEQEIEEDEDVGYEDNTETPTPTSNVISSKEGKLWSSAGRNISSPNNGHWNSNLCESHLDPDDLHIPRRTKEETRDDCKKSRTSTYGTYNPSKHSTPSTISGLSQTIQPHVMRKVIGETGSSLYTSAPCQDYRLSTPEKDNPYPDILGDNSDKYTGEVNINLNKNLGGSVDNINKSALYCTLPKKKSWRNAKYQSDSQSPLLPSSRYGSSGGDSYTSSRRLSDDTFRYPSINNNFRGNQRSCSYLNLVSTARPNPGTQNKNLDSTPLLDISGLESRFDREKILSPTNSSLVNSYDYHAAQLERFLEEYRTLQKELNKMKETCETICQGGEKNLSNSRFLDPLLHNNVLEDNPKSILKKSPPTTLSAGENSNFWSRNSQKRFEEVYYKS